MATWTGEAIEIYRLLALDRALYLQSKGIKAMRGPSALQIVKRDYPKYYKRTVARTREEFAAYMRKRVHDWRERGRPGLIFNDEAH